MQDRTSHSYRASLPGSTPDIYANGGKAREAFREARSSPYIREHSSKLAQGKSGDSQEDARKAFRAKRRKPQPAPSLGRGPSF